MNDADSERYPPFKLHPNVTDDEVTVFQSPLFLSGMIS